MIRYLLQVIKKIEGERDSADWGTMYNITTRPLIIYLFVLICLFSAVSFYSGGTALSVCQSVCPEWNISTTTGQISMKCGSDMWTNPGDPHRTFSLILKDIEIYWMDGQKPFYIHIHSPQRMNPNDFDDPPELSSCVTKSSHLLFPVKWLLVGHLRSPQDDHKSRWWDFSFSAIIRSKL